MIDSSRPVLAILQNSLTIHLGHAQGIYQGFLLKHVRVYLLVVQSLYAVIDLHCKMVHVLFQMHLVPYALLSHMIHSLTFK